MIQHFMLYTPLFDKPYEGGLGSYLQTGLLVSQGTLNIFQTLKACNDQSDTFNKMNLKDKFNLMSIDEALTPYLTGDGNEAVFWTHPIVGEEKLNALEEAMAVLTLGVTGMNFSKNIKSHFYFWHTWRAAGVFSGTLFTALDRWFSLGII